ncbi:MAG TPA: sulfite exporter TauE/SafE family protein [Longimicrobiales bacterium]|nr:sulfite exporter TauE/SafE family protein [Longimicrobiales bacterium]
MTAAALLALIIVGFAVGFLAGLVGIGGGVLIVPFLYFFYAHAAWSGVSISPSLHATVAHATSLFIIIPTALAGTATYARNGLVAWRSVLPIAVFSMLSAAIAAKLASNMPPELLKVAFGTFLVFTGIQLLTKRASTVSGPARTNMLAAGATGALVGIFSALLGVGGGLIALPMLMYVVRLDIRHIAATSLAIVAFAATAGTLTYMVDGAGLAGLPPGHIGYVHIAAALPMLPGAVLAARWGARLNQRIDATKLRRIFAVMFAVLGANLVIRNLPLLLSG